MSTVYGPLVDHGQVEDAIRDDLIRPWLDTYLLQLERLRGLEDRHFTRPRQWRVDDDIRLLTEDQLPLVAVISSGETQDPEIRADGTVDARLDVQVMAVVLPGGRNAQDDARTTIRCYAAAIAALIDHKGSFGQLGEALTRPRQRFGNEFNVADELLSVALVSFTAQVWGLRDAYALGPAAPVDPPETDPDPPPAAETPTAEQINITVEPRES